MKLISLNVEKGLHTEIILAFLEKEKADVICFQEFLEEDFEFFKKKLNLNGVFQLYTYTTSKSYPTLIGKKEGVVIFSKNIITVLFLYLY